MVAGGKAQQERDPRPHLGQVDEAGGAIRLSPARSKTLVGRILPISHPIAEALARRRARRDPDSPLVFHRDGIPVRRWRTAWRTACQATGAPIRFLHDYRRRRPHPDPRRCCTNRRWPARCPPTGFLPADAIRRWSAEGGHPIQYLTAEDDLTPLPSWAPGAKTIADDGLVAEERILHPALTMVP